MILSIFLQAVRKTGRIACLALWMSAAAFGQNDMPEQITYLEKAIAAAEAARQSAQQEANSLLTSLGETDLPQHKAKTALRATNQSIKALQEDLQTAAAGRKDDIKRSIQLLDERKKGLQQLDGAYGKIAQVENVLARDHNEAATEYIVLARGSGQGLETLSGRDRRDRLEQALLHYRAAADHCSAARELIEHQVEREVTALQYEAQSGLSTAQERFDAGARVMALLQMRDAFRGALERERNTLQSIMDLLNTEEQFREDAGQVKALLAVLETKTDKNAEAVGAHYETAENYFAEAAALFEAEAKSTSDAAEAATLFLKAENAARAAAQTHKQRPK